MIRGCYVIKDMETDEVIESNPTFLICRKRAKKITEEKGKPVYFYYEGLIRNTIIKSKVGIM